MRPPQLPLAGPWPQQRLGIGVDPVKVLEDDDQRLRLRFTQQQALVGVERPVAPLRRIEGQVRGLQRMVDEDVYCIDILTQISAATKALAAVALSLLEDHLGPCVRQAIAAGTPDADDKITAAADAGGVV